MGHSTSLPMSWYHHHINLLVPSILYDPVHSSYMSRKATCDNTVSCLYWIYPLIGHRLEVSIASSTGGQYHSPLVALHAVIPTILLAT